MGALEGGSPPEFMHMSKTPGPARYSCLGFGGSRGPEPYEFSLGCSIVLPVPGPGFRGRFYLEAWRERTKIRSQARAVGPFFVHSHMVSSRSRPKIGPGSPARGPEAILGNLKYTFMGPRSLRWVGLPERHPSAGAESFPVGTGRGL